MCKDCKSPGYPRDGTPVTPVAPTATGRPKSVIPVKAFDGKVVLSDGNDAYATIGGGQTRMTVREAVEFAYALDDAILDASRQLSAAARDAADALVGR